MLAPLLLAALSAAAPAYAAADVGRFTKKDCVAPSDFEQCYAEVEEGWADCVNNNCEGQNIDCINICSCIQTRAQLDCAGAYCWNQVYSCEYQLTAADLLDVCLNQNLNEIPFFPPPDNAEGGCSCNIANIFISQTRAVEELDSTCGIEAIENTSDIDEMKNIGQGCTCCTWSSVLSAIYDICPNTIPGLLGADDWYNALISKDEEWPRCGEYMEAYPCIDVLGVSAPSDNSTNFYSEGNFPANGTQTLFNTGSITSPVSGATYTYTRSSTEYVITVASPNAQPTGSSGGDGGSGSGSGSDNDNDSNDGGNSGNGDSNSGGDGGDSGDSSNSNGNGNGNDDDNSAAGNGPILLTAAFVATETIFSLL